MGRWTRAVVQARERMQVAVLVEGRGCFVM